MSDNEGEVEKHFAVERAKQGRATCKKCKQKCLANELRIAKVGPNPFGDGKMKTWFHVECMFEQFLKQRPTTKRIESSDDIDGFDLLGAEDQGTIEKTIAEYDKLICAKYNITPTVKPPKKKVQNTASNDTNSNKDSSSSSTANIEKEVVDYPFRKFRQLVADITNVSSYTEKTNVAKAMFTKGPDGSGFKGDMVTWCRLLLPGVVKRVYNLQSRILIKIFSKIFKTYDEDMMEHLQQGDIGETITHFFEKSNGTKPVKKSNLTINQVDSYLQKLTMLTKRDDQRAMLKEIAEQCTPNDLKVIIRLIKHDLRMNAGAKHILDGVHPKAYESYQSCGDIKTVINKLLTTSSSSMKKVTSSIALMAPILPMLAEACKSVDYAMKKCPNGMYSEIKYDGERVQVHKQGFEFKYYSRSLKPVLPHKIKYFKDYIPQAFPNGNDLILDCEILMVDSSGKPLPFGTLGIHKKSEFRDATVCLFVFDCLYYNGFILTNKPIKERKKILHKNMTEIKNHVMFSEYKTIYKPDDLSNMIAMVLQQGLEGLVLKDLHGNYEPGKRHWLKIKKDYLFGGAIADTADLIVLGAWYGTGRKGGIMSVFLMGCYDKTRNKFCTVTKVCTGHDDKTLERLQNELDMIKISADISKVPDWLEVTRTMVPDFVASDPKNQPVWEITGAEFSQHHVHTANGISIRFPRVTRIRYDKNWETATNLEELKVLVKNSKHTDVSLLLKGKGKAPNINERVVDKNKNSKKKKSFINSDDDSSQNSDDSLLLKEQGSVDASSSTSDISEPIVISKPVVDKNKNNKKKRSFINSDDDNSLPSTSTKPKKMKLPDVDIKNPLPDYFKGVKLLVEDCTNKEFVKYLRYFVAFGGEILTEDNWIDCNFVLHKDEVVSQPNIKAPSLAKHVHLDWLKDSVRNEEMQDFRPYLVKIVPENNSEVYSL